MQLYYQWHRKCRSLASDDARSRALAFVLLCLLARPAWAIDFGDRLDQVPSRRPTQRRALLQMVEQHQASRGRLIRAGNASTGRGFPEDEPKVLEVRRVDGQLLPRLRHIINQEGFPTTAMVDIGGVQVAFLLTRHADDDPVQARAPKIIALRRHQNEMNVAHYALLSDRVLTSEHKAAAIWHTVRS